MANPPEAIRRGADTAVGAYVLTPGTLVSAAVAVCLAQVALAIPAVLNGMFTTDLGATSSQLTWITDAFLVSGLPADGGRGPVVGGGPGDEPVAGGGHRALR